MATAAISQPTQATYGSYGVVTILERTRTLVRVLTNNELEFWVKAEKLKPVRVPKVAKAARPSPAVPSPAEPAEEAFIADPFITWLQANGCHIAVKTPSQLLKKLELAYEKATGQNLPSKSAGLSIVENGKPWSWSSEIFFKPTPDVPLPSFARPSKKTRRNFGTYYISKNSFALELLALGFHLGKNKPRV